MAIAVGRLREDAVMLLRLAYLGVTNAFALLRLLPGGDRDKDAEILAVRHQLAVLHRQLYGQRVRVGPADRAWLAALLSRIPRPELQNLRLLVRPDTIVRWHRDLSGWRYRACPQQPGLDVGDGLHAVAQHKRPCHLCWRGLINRTSRKSC
jgi:hypothetical protein